MIIINKNDIDYRISACHFNGRHFFCLNFSKNITFGIFYFNFLKLYACFLAGIFFVYFNKCKIFKFFINFKKIFINLFFTIFFYKFCFISLLFNKFYLCNKIIWQCSGSKFLQSFIRSFLFYIPDYNYGYASW